MTDPFLGEIRINAFRFAPKGWATCDGQTMQVQQYLALYSVIGRYYGGDGGTWFKLPDLRGRVPVGFASESRTLNHLSPLPLGTAGGVEGVALTLAQLPSHTHAWQATNTAGDTVAPKNNFYAQAPTGVNIYINGMGYRQVLHPKSMSEAGGNQMHSNMQPYLTLNFCISLLGYYPPRP